MSDEMTTEELAAQIRSLLAVLDHEAFALPDGRQTNILLVPGDVQVEGGMLPFAVVLARGNKAEQLADYVRDNLISPKDKKCSPRLS